MEKISPTGFYDAIIIGAGIAGLSAALVLRHEGKRFVVLEAANMPAGRAGSLRLADGEAIDMGAHWLHDCAENPLKALLAQYGIAYDKDAAEAIRSYKNGTMCLNSLYAEPQKAIDAKKAEDIKSGAFPDCPLPELGVDAIARQMLADLGTMWDGLAADEPPSAREYLTDKSKPGGCQPKGGITALIERMIADINAEHILYSMAVERVIDNGDFVCIETKWGDHFNAAKAIFTGSLGVIKSGMVHFQPPLDAQFQSDLRGIAMGHMTKIVAVIEEAFFAKRGIEKNTSCMLLDSDPPLFCHLRSAGRPIVQLFVGGPKSVALEAMSPAETVGFLRERLAPIPEMRGFETRLASLPIVSQWSGNAYTRGSYSACLPGGMRSGPRQHGNVIFAGDTFDTEFPASMAGAFRSGKKAAEQLIHLLRDNARLRA